MTTKRDTRGSGSKANDTATVRYEAFAIVAPGLAPLAAEELAALGIPPVSVEAAGVEFATDQSGLARANLHLRTVSRVLVRVDEFRAATFHELEKRTARIDWGRWLEPGRDVSLRVTCRKSRLYHSGAVAQRVAAQLAPAAGRVSTGGAAPDGTGTDETDDDGDAQLLVVRIHHDRCTISLDSSGALLHQRGYRREAGKAPLRETLGAALLLASGWVPGAPLVDPFCGSGTLAIEGALLARGMAPGRLRGFAFERWPGHDAEMMGRIRQKAATRETASVPGMIVASDRDAGVIAAARENAERAGVAADIHFDVRAVSSLALPAEVTGVGSVVTNPPYGVRVGEAGELRNLYARTGAVLRTVCPGWTLALVSADRRLVGELGIPLVDRLRTSNGGLPVTFATGEIPAPQTAQLFSASERSTR
ncbi:MAG: class I SAM-dependent RNA methyltransferase [Gemmatimonadota bacterium]